MARYISSRLNRSQPPPQLHRFGMKQAFHALMQEARRRGLDFKGRPTGVYQKGWQVYLYVDIGVGRVIPRIVKKVPPLDARVSAAGISNRCLRRTHKEVSMQ